MLLGPAPGTEDGNVDPLIGALDLAESGMGKRASGDDCTGRDTCCFQERATADRGFFLH